MKLTLGLIAILLFSNSSFAVPRGNILVQPTKIVKGAKNFTVYATLPCKSISAPEWGVQLVSGWDDEGDQAFSIGLVVSTDGSYCEKGSSKEYSLEFPYSVINLEAGEIENVELVPMDVAK